MQIEYDKQIDTKYVRIKKGKVAKTKRVHDWLLVDYTKEGDVLGVEILDASQHLVSFYVVSGKLISYSFVEPIPLKDSYEGASANIQTSELQFA